MALAKAASRGTFNREAFYQAVNLTRNSRNLTWFEVAEQSGVSAATVSRLNHGEHLSVHTVAALIAWGGLDPRSFMAGGDAACAFCGEPGPGAGSHASLIDCVMALKARVAELERTYITFTGEKALQHEQGRV